jgi:hypothetical protein
VLKILGVDQLEVEGLGFYIATFTEISGQCRFTSWQTTGKYDAWISAHSGLLQVSPVTSTLAAIAVAVAAQRKLNASRSRYQFIHSGGTKDLVGWAPVN